MRFMRGPRDYCKGVQVFLPENSSDNVVFCFFSPQLILQRVSNGYFKENYYFLRFQRGPNFFNWGGATFPGGGGPDPLSPPSGSAHAISQLIFLISKGNNSCGGPKYPSQEDDSFEHQNKCLDL